MLKLSKPPRQNIHVDSMEVSKDIVIDDEISDQEAMESIAD